ncbi:hypothetical protein [Luteibacter sp. 329MFSha]|uniref:hypothetical protein n=1 Tax=Luteibacter sp. 329MFSha TaxID=1798239 RepID=UPI0008AC668A|nr:hypothetical protein [Luteibacter sp. 329MFSha]SEV87396.1 hypothetical protein SAMN04515660_0516 [Luteibacter sp. 329MFSha]
MKLPPCIPALSVAIAASLSATASAHTDPAAPTLITFGDDGAATSASRLTPERIDALASAPAGTVLSELDTATLPLSAAESTTLRQLFSKGVPVLLHMDQAGPADLARVTEIFGIAPTGGDVVLRRRDDGGIRVYAPTAGADDADLLLAMATDRDASSHATPAPAIQGRDVARFSARLESATAGDTPLLPARHFDVNFVDAAGEVSGVTGIDVLRSRTAAADIKFVTITSKATVTTAKNGISDGKLTGQNLWATWLPTRYRVAHSIDADGATPVYVDHFPLTDGRTEFTQTDTKMRGFTVGGSTGSEVSHSGKPDELLAAKLPFNLSFGYEHKWQSSVTTTFKDYSLLAAPEANRSVRWTALLAPKLINVLVKRVRANEPQLTEEWMTPMMRSATLETLSQWKLPGGFEGMATVTVAAGYTLDRNEWRWKRVDLVHTFAQDERDVPASFAIDMSDPYLSAETTVLIRSAVGSGPCLTGGDVVGLAPCNVTDRRQMWGLDAAKRYVNRATGRCLATQPASGNVVTEACENVTFEKQWQWRADRLHSLVDHGRYRLYVENGQVRFQAPPGRFQDYPVNPFATPLEPWTNYPNAPRPGVDLQPAPAGSRPIPIDDAWASFAPVSDDQRWYVEVLRQGL